MSTELRSEGPGGQSLWTFHFQYETQWSVQALEWGPLVTSLVSDPRRQAGCGTRVPLHPSFQFTGSSGFARNAMLALRGGLFSVCVSGAFTVHPVHLCSVSASC